MALLEPLTPAQAPNTVLPPVFTRNQLAAARNLLLIAASAAFILVATLSPAGRTIDSTWNWSLASGEAALAELLQNLIFFIPFGIGLALTGMRPLVAIALGTLLSFSVEFAQQWIPGRDPAVADIVCNTISTAVGVGLVRNAQRWLLVSPQRAGRQALGAAILAVLVWFGTAAVLKPTFGTSPYVILERPDFNNWGRYRGTVTEAAMLHGMLAVKATFPKSPPRRPSPLAAIMNAQGQRATILAIVERDLTMRYYMPAVKLTLEQPDLRWDGVLATVAPGDTFTAHTGHEAGKICFGFNQSWRCDVGYTIGDGWKLIFYPEHWPGWRLVFINACWVMGCVVFVGFWAGRTSLNDGSERSGGEKGGGMNSGGEGRRRAAKAAVAIVLLALIVVPMTTHLKGSSLFEWVGALVGIELGLFLGSRKPTARSEA